MEGETAAQEIAEQHRALDGLFARAREALRAGDAEGADGALDGLRTALEIHFGQEGHLYYPAVWALRPDQEEALRSFLRDHERFRNQLVRIQLRIGEATAEAAGSFEAFVDDFLDHEVREERLLRSLERQTAEAAPTPGRDHRA